MFRSTTAAILAVIITALVAVPAGAAKRPKLCDTAAGVRAVVVKKHGKRAPGRNICRYGVQSKFNAKWAKPATVRQKAIYVRALRALIAPPPPLLVRTAVAPGQPPAGTLQPSVAPGSFAQCVGNRESGSSGSYGANTGNGYYGRYQFDQQTWSAAGGSGRRPDQASPAAQDAAFARWYPGHPRAWPRTGPACGGR